MSAKKKLPSRFEDDPVLTDDDFESLSMDDADRDEEVSDEDEDLYEVAEEIWDEIEDDLRDRSGVGDVFDSVDDEIMDEIRQSQISHILKVLKREFE